MRLITCLCLAILATGCVVPGKSRVFVLGFGIVSVDSPTNSSHVVRTKVIGVSVTDFPVRRATVGYADSQLIAIEPNSETLIEIK